MKIRRKINMAVLTAKKHSPAILIATGIAGGIGATVLACKATLRAKDICEEHQNDMAIVEERHKHNATQMGKPYSEEDYKKDKVNRMTQTVVQLTKEYAPAVVLGGLSVLCILKSHNILSRRKVALATGLASVESTFANYRKKVADKIGEKAENELRYQTKATETVTNEGEKVTYKKPTKENVNHGEFFFDELCDMWTSSAVYNKSTLLTIENALNTKLITKGYVTIADLKDQLGMPVDKKQLRIDLTYGWLYSQMNGQKIKLLNDQNRSINEGFYLNVEPSVLLTPNYTGYLL